MCGIAGIVKKKHTGENISHLKKMLKSISHRGPDDEGIFQKDEVILGHRRLSIIDLSFKAHQPMIYKNQASIVFNGEIYNYQNLKKELIQFGYKFSSNSDTEVLLIGYIHFGLDILNKIKGFFSFVIYDMIKNKLICARDPFGKKPFYYFENDEKFVFASEVNAVVSGLENSPEANYKGLSHYLLKGYYQPGFSGYDGIYTLKSGHFLEFNLKTKEKKITSYNSPSFSMSDSKYSYEEVLDISDHLIKRSINDRLISDVPLGTLLSGGVDSSLITLFLAENSEKPVNAFTLSFKEKIFDETDFAKKVANHQNIEHIISSGDDIHLKNILPTIVSVYGEPFGDPSSLPTYQVFEAVKKELKVVLTGDGGDEVFGGYKSIIMYFLRNKFQPVLKNLSLLFNYWPEILLNSKISYLRQISHASISMRHNGSEPFYSLYRNAWTENFRKSAMRKESWRKIGGNDIEVNFIQKFQNSGQNDIERYLNLNLERLSESFLVKVDRASMANSVEVRCPLLDLNLFSFISKLPQNILLKNNIRKSIPKSLLSKVFDNKFVHRSKMGFTPPLTSWLRDKKTLKWVEKKLLSKESITYELFEPKYIKKMLLDHQSGYDNSTRIWYLLFLEEWHGKFIYK